MTYSPYTSSGQCKDAGDVATDIASIKAMGFSTVRIYSTDCNGLSTVGSACSANGLKLILGVYIAAGGVSTGEEQISAIVSWAQWDIVELVVVGNEAVFNKWASPQELAGFIGECKGKLKAAGYNGPVTTTEPVDVLQQYGSAWADVVDVVGAQMHPFFNGGSCDDVGPFMTTQIQLAGQSFPGKDVYILETGWPTAGQTNGQSVPGPSEQKTAIDQIVGVAGSKACFFSFSDDLWKAPGDYDVEQHWGCASVFQ
jgi:exo-beta-1,3-glucanase (GH17 family)